MVSRGFDYKKAWKHVKDGLKCDQGAIKKEFKIAIDDERLADAFEQRVQLDYINWLLSDIEYYEENEESR